MIPWFRSLVPLQSDFAAALVMLLLAACFAGAAGLNVLRTNLARAKAAEGVTLLVSRSEVLGPKPVFRGDYRAPYTLVEYGDYQCPYCRVAAPEVDALVRREHGELNFVFRNFPLSMIHPQAMKAAILAEEARGSGRFWEVHDILYRGDSLTAGELTRAKLTAGDSAPVAACRMAVQSDIRAATAIGVLGTPTFILCDVHGHVLKISALADVPVAMGSNRGRGKST